MEGRRLVGDYSNFSMTAYVADPAVQAAVKTAYEEYAGSFSYYQEDQEDDYISLGSNDVRMGSVEQLVDDLRNLISTGIDCPTCESEGTVPGAEVAEVTCTRCSGSGRVTVTDFAFSVNDEPKYEWMGTIVIHVPGMDDFTGLCDAEGTPTLTSTEVTALVNGATDLDELKAALAKLTGDAHMQALRS